MACVNGRPAGDSRITRVFSARKTLHCFKDRFGLQQHARPAAKRPVIHRLVAVMRVIAQIMDRQIQPPRFPRPLDDAFIQRPREHRRETT